MGTRHRELHEGRIDPGLCGRRLAATIGTVPRRRRRSLREEVISALAGFDLLLGLWWGFSGYNSRPANCPKAKKTSECVSRTLAKRLTPMFVKVGLGGAGGAVIGLGVVQFLPARRRTPRRLESIPERVRHEVWRRDQGRCVECGSSERLEFDHIIPLSKGGANTARNIELRCESQPRERSEDLGDSRWSSSGIGDRCWYSGVVVS